MKMNYMQPRLDQQDQIHVTIVIDAFRAFATASYILERHPVTYIITPKSDVINRLLANYPNHLLIGKPEIGSDLSYDIPNSPTRVQGVNITDRNIFHRTEAGARGILLARNSDIILAAGFVNADATVKYIKGLINPKITILPMGHEATTPSLEDNLCALYIKALLNNTKISLTPFLSAIRKSSGRYFFLKDQLQYPREDFKKCLEIKRFNFAIRATIRNDHAILTRHDI